MRYGVWIALGFLSGGVLYSYLLPKWLCKVNVVADSDDHNPGTANAYKLAGPLVGTLCLLCDVGKGFWPVFVAARQINRAHALFALVLAAPVLGHALAPFSRQKGGKAIAVSFGVLLGLVPFSFAVCLLAAPYLFFSLVVVIRPHRLRSIWAMGCFAVGVLLLEHSAAIRLGCWAIAGTVVVKHLRASSDDRPAMAFYRRH